MKANITQLHIEYCTNYNGVNFIANGVPVWPQMDQHVGTTLLNETDRRMLVQLEDAITTKASEDLITSGRLKGSFNGDTDELEQFIMDACIQIFGDQLAVDVEFDHTSD